MKLLQEDISYRFYELPHDNEEKRTELIYLGYLGNIEEVDDINILFVAKNISKEYLTYNENYIKILAKLDTGITFAYCVPNSLVGSENRRINRIKMLKYL